MWDQSDFSSLREDYREHARDYTEHGSNQLAARTLFVTTHALHQFHSDLETSKGEHVNERHHMQLLYLKRGIQELRSVFWLVENYSYTACQGRLRFLLETYTVVRELNRDKDKTEKDFIRLVEETVEGDYDEQDSKPMTEYFSGKRQQLRGKLAENTRTYSDVYDLMSNLGSHPHSIQSMALDGDLDTNTEVDVIHFALMFVYALSAQYRRTFEETSLRNWVANQLDSLMVQAELVVGRLPLFLEEDLDYSP